MSIGPFSMNQTLLHTYPLPSDIYSLSIGGAGKPPHRLKA